MMQLDKPLQYLAKGATKQPNCTTRGVRTIVAYMATLTRVTACTTGGQSPPAVPGLALGYYNKNCSTPNYQNRAHKNNGARYSKQPGVGDSYIGIAVFSRLRMLKKHTTATKLATKQASGVCAALILHFLHP